MKVLIVRQDGIGDALVLTPLLVALRDAGHELGAVLSTRNAELFARRTFTQVHVTERIAWPRHGSTSATYTHALDDVRAARYDAAIIATEEPEAYRFARAAGIPQRVGFWNGLEKPLKSLWVRMQCTRVVQRAAQLGREPEHEAQTMSRLGAMLTGGAPPTTEVSRLRALILDEQPEPIGDVLVQLTSKWRTIGVARGGVEAMLAALGERYAVRTIAPPEELDDPRLLDEHVEITRTLAAWKRAVARAGVVVTPDTGTAHLAGMLGIPTVDVFADGASAVAQWARWHPWATVAEQVLTRGEPETFAAEIREAVDRFVRIFSSDDAEDESEA